MNNHLSLSIAAVACASLFSSCAHGPKYGDVKKSGALLPHQGHGMVLIYRTPGLVGAADPGQYVYAKHDVLLGQLPRGGFYSYEAAPGPLNLMCTPLQGESSGETKSKRALGGAVSGALVMGPVGAVVGSALSVAGDSEEHRKHRIDITVVPGQTHFFTIDAVLEPVSNEKGEDEIQGCHWLNPAR